jgi:rfaE bifunctional protein nucleotidyltransferase chain/domain
MPKTKGRDTMVRSAARKIVPRAKLSVAGARLRHACGKVVFTNGCFDLLHPGHVALIEKARSLGGALVVGLNSDRSVRALKGPGRPLLKQDARARMLAALACVDLVTVFPERTPLKTISLLRPDVLVKGADWDAGSIVGREEVESWGGRVVRLPLKGGFSTTGLIRKILRRAATAARSTARDASPRKGRAARGK